MTRKARLNEDGEVLVQAQSNDDFSTLLKNAKQGNGPFPLPQGHISFNRVASKGIRCYSCLNKIHMTPQDLERVKECPMCGSRDIDEF